MSKPQTFAQRCALAIKILAGAAMNLELTTADGSTLTIEREEGDPQVGDVASPDGEHVMPDGTTIVVADGVITEIISAEGESPEDQLETANARIADLESQLPTAEERATLNAVVALGGSKVLATMCSSYKVPPRDPQTATTPKVANYQKQLQTYKNRK